MGTGDNIKSHKKIKFEIEQHIKELTTLNEIGIVIASIRELDKLWKSLYEQLSRLIEVPVFCITIYDKENDEFYDVINMLNGHSHSKAKKSCRPGNECIEYIIHTNKPLLICGDTKIEDSKPAIASVNDRVKSYLGVPIATCAKVIGVMAVQDYKHENAFNEHTVEILSSIAGQAAVAIENARLHEETQRHLKEMTALQKIGMRLTSSLDISDLLQYIAESALKLTDGSHVHIFSLNPETNKFTQRAAACPPHVKKPPLIWPRKTGLSGAVLKSQKPVIIEKAFKHPIYSSPEAQKWGVQSAAGFPLKRKFGLTGVLNVAFLKPHVFGKEEINLLSLLAGQAAVAIENARLHEETQKKATTDYLTKVWSRRYFDDYLRDELARAKRLGRRLSVLMIDIDNFKSFNDTYGHSSGDEIICSVARAILASCRKVDVVGRYGGDEFAVILLETNGLNAVNISKRILNTIKKSPFIGQNGNHIPITVSIGIASFPSDGKNAEQLISLADAAMYNAKSSGGGDFSNYYQ